jgi:hypothetical protein
MQNNNPQMLESAQRLLALSQQPTEGKAMSEQQTDIAERLRLMADDLVLFKEIDTGADDMREAADEIEALRADLDKCAKLALSAVHAERPCIHHFDPSTRTEANDVVLSEVCRTEAACESGAMNLKGVVKGATWRCDEKRIAP